MAQQKFADACTAFESSYHLEPDISTLLNHADCREKNGQFATAWIYRRCRRTTIPILPYCNSTRSLQHVPATSRRDYRSFRLMLRPPIGLTASESCDANLVEPGLWNHLQPIDGGTYRITARAPGRVTWSTTVIVNPEGDVQVVAVPKLDLPTVPIAPEPKPDQRLPAPPNAASPSATLPIVTPPIATPLKAKPVPSGCRRRSQWVSHLARVSHSPSLRRDNRVLWRPHRHPLPSLLHRVCFGTARHLRRVWRHVRAELRSLVRG